MAKIRDYETKTPEQITRDEHSIVTDIVEQKTYKINLSDYVDEIAGITGFTGSYPDVYGNIINVVNGVVKTADLLWFDYTNDPDKMTQATMSVGAGGSFEFEVSHGLFNSWGNYVPDRIRLKSNYSWSELEVIDINHNIIYQDLTQFTNVGEWYNIDLKGLYGSATGLFMIKYIHTENDLSIDDTGDIVHYLECGHQEKEIAPV